MLTSPFREVPGIECPAVPAGTGRDAVGSGIRGVVLPGSASCFGGSSGAVR